MENFDEHNELEERLFSYLEANQDSDFTGYEEEFDSFDENVFDFDFSNVEGKNFKSDFVKVNRKISKVVAPSNRPVIVQGRSQVRKKPIGSTSIPRPTSKPTSRPISRPISTRKISRQELGSKINRNLVKTKNIDVTKRATIFGKNKNIVSKVIVPRDKEVIVEGVSKFILSTDKKHDQLRQIGYYKGEKLKEMVLIFNNDSAVDFIVDIFNMSMPLNYLYSTSQNLNNKIQVAGGNVQYSDLLFNLLANPTMILNCKFTFSGPQTTQQIAIPLEIVNQDIQGIEEINPINLALKIDTFQFANDIVLFDMQESLNKHFVPNGMQFIKYKVLAGMTVTMAFFFKQVDLEKVFYPETRKQKSIV
jgi:hypothetical protein